MRRSLLESDSGDVRSSIQLYSDQRKNHPLVMATNDKGTKTRTEEFSTGKLEEY